MRFVQQVQIDIYTINHEQGIILSVIDNGIGMNNKTMKYNFDKICRKLIGDLLNIEGFGLVLFYVKVIS